LQTLSASLASPTTPSQSLSSTGFDKKTLKEAILKFLDLFILPFVSFILCLLCFYSIGSFFLLNEVFLIYYPL
jgi:hypothetical protein